MRLNNKVAIITGAASGMGKAIAILYAKEGARVVVSDMNINGAQETVSEIKANGGTAIAMLTNVTKEEDVKALIETTIKEYGTLDIIVNNAGIMDNMAPVGEVSNESWDRLISVNTTSVMLCMREALKIFTKKKSGVIINIASIGGFRGGVAGAAYTASKHAVVGLTKSTGFQYAKAGIRCNAIAPGPIRTNISNTMTEMNEQGTALCRMSMSTISRLGEPEEIATVAVFLASDDASFVNGQTIAVDGGWTA